MTDVAAFDHIGLAVAGLSTMTRWYTDALGLKTEFDFNLPEAGFSGVMLSSGDGYRIELLHREGGHAGPRPAGPLDAALTHGYGHFALDLPDVDRAYAALVRAGASGRMGPRPSPEPGVRMAFVADPEGNLIELLNRTAAGSRS